MGGERARRFGPGDLGVAGRPAADRCTGSSTGCRTTTARSPGAALLEQSLATMECRTVGSLPGGDHTIVVGEVLAIGTRDSDDGGLIHFRGRYDRIH